MFLRWLTKNGNITIKINVDTEAIMNEIDQKLAIAEHKDSLSDAGMG